MLQIDSSHINVYLPQIHRSLPTAECPLTHTLYCRIFFAEATSMADLKEVIREQDKGWVVRLRGLPFKATQEDVLDFFGGIEVTNGLSGITLIYGRDGRPMGEAYVELPDEESQTKALHLDRERMGARYIEVFKSTKADLSVV